MTCISLSPLLPYSYFLAEMISDLQVKAANKLLKSMPPNEKKQRVDGVPVFGAQNLDIAVATSDGIKW